MEFCRFVLWTFRRSETDCSKQAVMCAYIFGLSLHFISNKEPLGLFFPSFPELTTVRSTLLNCKAKFAFISSDTSEIINLSLDVYF